MQDELHRIDPWDVVNARYERDEDARFLIFVEQFAEAATLFRTGSLAKQRMALVAADNLAEMVLHRHVRRTVRMSEEAGWLVARRFGARERKKLSSDFGARISLATKQEELDQIWRSGPILDEGDAAIFRVARAYRSRAYHADHHNPAILPLLTRAFLASVGRAFIRSQPENVASSMWNGQEEALRGFGYDPNANQVFPGDFAPHDAADQIIGRLLTGIGLTLPEAKTALKEDLLWRMDWACAMVDHLLGQGMPKHRLEFGLAWSRFWDEQGADDELTEIAARRAVLWDARIDDPGGATPEALRAVEAEYENRLRELASGFKPTLSLGRIDHVRRRAHRLDGAQSLANLFTTYRDLDARAEELERALDDAAMGWERMIEQEIDRHGGK